jgi:hypothetical protein
MAFLLVQAMQMAAINNAQSITGPYPSFYDTINRCDSSWTESATSFKHHLIELSKDWTDIGLAGSCPYQPTESELTRHSKLHEEFETAQTFNDLLMALATCHEDGWVPWENWDEALETATDYYVHWLTTCSDSDAEEEKEEDGEEDLLLAYPFNEFNGRRLGEIQELLSKITRHQFEKLED